MDKFELSEDCKTLIEYKGHDTNLEIPEGVENIQSYAFNGCEGLSLVKLPSTIKDISRWAFNECLNISEIVFPKGISCNCMSSKSHNCFYW